MSLFDVRPPLAARMRPRTLEEFVGQDHLLGPGRSLGEAIRAGTVGSMIFWGPPGSGKTSLAHLIAHYTDRHFVPFSAVTEGVARVREIIAGAEQRRTLGRGTILFCDEIHRFNRSQQDAFLPHVESGVITLVGATTENPSFELTGALLSRTRVYVLDRLTAGDIGRLLSMALEDRERGVGDLEVTAEPGALAALAEAADGDARRALTVLEAAAERAGQGGVLTAASLLEVMAARIPTHDKSGEEHFNILSAYHKSLRGSDPQGALYWMARLIEGGEDPMTIFRRAIAMASEDIGLADPQALTVAVAGRDAWHQLGAPEGYLALAEVTIYLATAPKSNSVYLALQAAREAARRTAAAPVPLHLRNAPTGLMKALGYGAAYQYPHDLPDGFSPQPYLPAEVGRAEFYRPGSRGFEKKVAERLAWWETIRIRDTGEGSSGAPPGHP
ncbi:MAG TPA: replication-associated recombination protein A [Gemmatimonadales bacterium]